MGEHVINFVEGEGISIQAAESANGEMWDVEIASTVTGAADAADVSIADAGGYYTATNVEDALQEIAAAGVWIPLFDSPDGTAVLDTDHAVILTLVPIA
jgi:hypothetical protein